VTEGGQSFQIANILLGALGSGSTAVVRTEGGRKN
jgi:hypothetical protein